MFVDDLIRMLDAAPNGMYASFGSTNHKVYRRTYYKRAGLWEWIWAEQETMTSEELVTWMLDPTKPNPGHFVGISPDPQQLVSHA